MNIIRNEPETLHIGADFNRGYRVAEGFDLTGCTATMKVRSIHGKLLAEATCTIQDHTVFCVIPADATKAIDANKYTKGKYDVFIQHGGVCTKVVMGDIAFIPDVSMH